MSNAKTGVWSAAGAVLGALGGTAVSHAVGKRSPVRYTGKREDRIFLGSAVGAGLGAFVAGMAAGESSPPQTSSQPSSLQSARLPVRFP
jgi:hypothetical protein